MQSTGRIYMDRLTIEHGQECSDCLRWFMPVFKDDHCPHCHNYGQPQYPNRIRYLTLKKGYTLRELSRRSGLAWRTVRLIYQGHRAPHIGTKKKLLRALGVSTKRSELNYVFPHERRQS
jgi:lambda repressor-like predicted transcriptional regulator